MMAVGIFIACALAESFRKQESTVAGTPAVTARSAPGPRGRNRLPDEWQLEVLFTRVKS